MRLMRIGERGEERPVVLVDKEHYVDVTELAGDFDERFFGSGGLDRLRAELPARIAGGEVERFRGERIGAPIARPHQILCIGLNYHRHAAETGSPIPNEPILFTKSPNTLVGPNDDVRLPRDSRKADWEVELGIVIGSRCSYLDDDESARRAIAGYVICNDVSERAFQLEHGGQWSKGKSAETFNPCGPWLRTADEVDDVGGLDLWLDVNGARRQEGTTSDLIFDPYFIVRYLSRFMVLEPGDLINTGTPHGVGMAMDPPQWLRAGDVMELGITGLGVQRQRVVEPVAHTPASNDGRRSSGARV